MIHGIHRFQVYTKKRHWILACAVILLPFLFLILVGRLGNVSMETLGSALLISFYRLFLGYVVSLVVGVALALILGVSSWGDSVMPVLDVMQNVPSFALIPVFALTFGYTDTMAILFIATSVVWPILFYTLSAIRTARLELNEAATVFGATGFKRVTHYLLPLSLPAIVTGSIVGLSIGWEAVIGIEIIGLSSGIGIVLDAASKRGETSVLVAGIGLLLFLVFVINRLVWAPLLKQAKKYAD